MANSQLVVVMKIKRWVPVVMFPLWVIQYKLGCSPYVKRWMYTMPTKGSMSA